MSIITKEISLFTINLLKRKGIILDEKPLNEGFFGQIYRAKRKGISVAVKVIDCEKTSEDYRLRFLPKELFVLMKLKHRFIITLYEILTISNRVFVVMELAEGGDLFDLLKAGPVPDSKARVLFKQISTALKYIHSQAIAHRDLKCENVLLNRNYTIAKLTDFGFARTVFEHSSGQRLLSTTQCGTISYVSPELLSGKPFDAIKSDCWSIGVVLYILVLNKMPFSTKKPQTMLKRQIHRRYDLYDQDLNPDCKDLIQRLLEPDIQSRLTMEQVLNHRWIKKVHV